MSDSIRKQHFILLRRLNRPVITLLLTGAVYAVFIGLRLGLHGFDPSFFITAGDRFCNAELVPEKIIILENSAGYDGQFYYRLALNPFTSKAFDFGIRLDKPAHRQQRILYPAIVWLGSFGHAAYVPFLMIAVNLGALCVIGWLGGAYARAMKRHALWGLVFSLYPGFILILARDLTEILEISLLMGCLLFIRKERQIFATTSLTLAVFAKETALLLTVGLFFSYLFSKGNKTNDNSIKWYLFGIPVFSYCAWQSVLFLHWHQFPVFSGGNQIDLPLVGIIKFVFSNQGLDHIVQVFFFAEFLFVIFFTLCVVYSFGYSTALKHEKYSWIAYGLLMAMLTDAIWLEDWGFLRALCDFYMLGWVIVLASTSRIRFPILACSSGLWAIVSCMRIYFV